MYVYDYDIKDNILDITYKTYYSGIVISAYESDIILEHIAEF